MKTVDGARFDVNGAVVECSMVPWDTDIFGFAVAQVDRIDLGAAGSAASALDAFDAWCAERDVRLVACRIDHDRIAETMALEDRGFRFVEMVYHPRLARFDGIEPPRHAIEVAVAGPDDVAAITAIAETAFDTGRFLLDPRLPGELSRRRYATWVRTSVAAPSHDVLTFRLEDELVGFFIVERRPGGDAYWHLTAIAPDWQGRGIGLSVWRTMLLRHRAEGANAVETTISAHNVAAMNLYARLGFTFAAAQTTLHWIRGGAIAAAGSA